MSPFCNAFPLPACYNTARYLAMPLPPVLRFLLRLPYAAVATAVARCCNAVSRAARLFCALCATALPYRILRVAFSVQRRTPRHTRCHLTPSRAASITYHCNNNFRYRIITACALPLPATAHSYYILYHLFGSFLPAICTLCLLHICHYLICCISSLLLLLLVLPLHYIFMKQNISSSYVPRI